MISTVRLLAVIALALLSGGCHFDNPLTGGPTKDINTWLLGVWEHKGADGEVSTIRVLPLTGDRYSIQAVIAGKTPKAAKKYEFEGWNSHVGETSFLSLRCEKSPGDIPAGVYVFVHTQLLAQNRLRLRGLQLDSPPTATSLELRKEVRQRFKDRTLYDEAQTTDWKRVEEVIWTTDGSDPAFKPLRNPTP